jgi:hypothetical protein
MRSKQQSTLTRVSLSILDREHSKRSAAARQERAEKSSVTTREDVLKRALLAEQIISYTPHEVVCRCRLKPVVLDKKRLYDLHNWTRHLVTCSWVNNLNKRSGKAVIKVRLHALY